MGRVRESGSQLHITKVFNQAVDLLQPFLLYLSQVKHCPKSCPSESADEIFHSSSYNMLQELAGHVLFAISFILSNYILSIFITWIGLIKLFQKRVLITRGHKFISSIDGFNGRSTRWKHASHTSVESLFENLWSIDDEIENCDFGLRNKIVQILHTNNTVPQIWRVAWSNNSRLSHNLKNILLQKQIKIL